MIERFLHLVSTDPALGEAPAATRERLRGAFPAGASRRMSQLGMLVGKTLSDVKPEKEDQLVYATRYGESRSLEAFLDSFPAASPTSFQSSIHPSGVQQMMIGRQTAVREFYPLTGERHLVVQALVCALLFPGARSVVCGGEEAGGWLKDCGGASETAFAYAFDLRRHAEGALASLRFEQGAYDGEMRIESLFELLHHRRSFDGGIGPGWRLTLAWIGGSAA